MTKLVVKLKRIYEKPEIDDGFRILVDRLWPRGVSKQEAKFDLWLKTIAPTRELRQWFKHDPEKWTEFKRRYYKELKENQALKELKAIAKKNKSITLLFAAKDTKHNEAVVLKELLLRDT